jgi:hypothetical protein
MRLKDLMRTEETYRKYTDDFDPSVKVKVVTDKSEPLAPSGFGALREYITTVIFSVKTRCNSVEFDSNDFQKRIEAHLLHHIYGHLTGHCHEALNAIDSGNRKAALIAVFKIINAIKCD